MTDEKKEEEEKIRKKPQKKKNGLTDVFDEPAPHQLLPPKPLPRRVVPPRQRVHVLLAQLQPPSAASLPVLLDDEQRPAAAAGVGVEPELLQPDVVHDPDLGVDVDLAPHRAQRGYERGRVAVHADPRAVEEDLGRRRHDRGRDLLEALGAPLVQEVLHGGLRAADRDVGHQGQVLDEPGC